MSYTIKVECPICHRYLFRDWPDDPQGQSTSRTCARCFCAWDHKKQDGLSRALLKKTVAEDQGVVWEGEERFKESFSYEDIAAYDEILHEVEREKTGEGNLEGKR